MRGHRLQFIAMSAALTAGSWPAAAAPLSAQSTPHGFISTRYDSHTSSVLFVGYTVGKVTPVFALVENPHSDYREELVGIFRTQRAGPHLALTLGAAATNTTDAWYGQLFVFPSLGQGRLHTDVRLKFYLPAERRGVMQCDLSPGSVTVDLSRRLSAGAVVVWSAEHGARHAIGAGPSLKLHVPSGAITLDGVLGVTNWTSEYRVGFFTTY